MGKLAAAIRALFIAQRAYEEARTHHASDEELLVLAEAMSAAIITHGAAMQKTPRSQWQFEADAALTENPS